MTKGGKLLAYISEGVDRRDFLRGFVTATGSLLAAVTSIKGEAYVNYRGCRLVRSPSSTCNVCMSSWTWFAPDYDKCVWVACLECCDSTGADAQTICSTVWDVGRCLPPNSQCTCEEDLEILHPPLPLPDWNNVYCMDAPPAPQVISPPPPFPDRPPPITLACAQCIVRVRDLYDALGRFDIGLPSLEQFVRDRCRAECDNWPWW